jgi:hypothetical protein
VLIRAAHGSSKVTFLKEALCYRGEAKNFWLLHTQAPGDKCLVSVHMPGQRAHGLAHPRSPYISQGAARLIGRRHCNWSASKTS